MIAAWFSPCADGERPEGVRRSLLFFLVFFVLALGLLGSFFLPVITLPYAYSDDLYLWSYDPTKLSNLLSYPQNQFIVGAGRFLLPPIVGLYGLQIATLDDIGPMRGVTVALAALGVAGTAFWLCRLHIGRALAFGISLGIFLLPGVQANVSWIIGAPLVVALMTTILSAAVAQKVSLTDMRRGRLRALRGIGLVALSCVLLIASLFIYQVTPMFFLLFVLARILFSPRAQRRATWRRTTRDLAIFVLSGALYFAIQRLVIMPIYFSMHPQLVEKFQELPTWQFALTTLPRIPHRLGWLVKYLSVRALNLWHCEQSRPVALSVLAVILLGCAAGGVRTFRARNREGFWRPLWGHYAPCAVAVAALLVAVNTPLLAARGLEHRYRGLAARLTFPYSAMLVLLCAWAVFQLTWALKEKSRAIVLGAVIGVTVTAAGLAAQRNLLTYGMMHVTEQNYVRYRIAPHLARGGRAVHLVRQKYKRDPNSIVFLDEFANPVSYHWGVVPWMVKGILVSYVNNPLPVRVSTSYFGHPYETVPGMLVLDMNDLSTPYGEKPPRSELVHQQGYKSFNIYRLFDIYGTTYFGLPRDECDKVGDSLQKGFSVVYVGASEDEVRRKIDDPRHAPPAPGHLKASWVMNPPSAGAELLAWPSPGPLLTGSIRTVSGSGGNVRANLSREGQWHVLDLSCGPTLPFWEIVGKGPHWLLVEMAGKRALNGYALQSWTFKQDPERMPRDWRMQGSDDAKTWVDLDTRLNEGQWKNLEERRYPIAKPAAFRFYRLYVSRANNPGILRLRRLKLLLTPESP